MRRRERATRPSATREAAGHRGGEGIRSFQPRDEGTHAAGPQEHWNESFYLNFFDPEQGWGAVSRLGLSPNRGFADGFVCLYFPDGTTGFIRTWEACRDHRGRSSAGAIEHVCVEPFKRWRVHYRGPIHHFDEPARMGDFAQAVLVDLPRRELELVLEFEAIHEIFDFHDSMKRELLAPAELWAKLRPGYLLDHLGLAIRKLALARTMSGAQHYEHAGRIRGSISIDGQALTVAGYGQRDHSWGVRDMRVPSSWRWFSGQLADSLCFNAIKVEVLGFRASGGYVYHEGLPEPLSEWSLEAERETPRGAPKHVSLQLASLSGKYFRIEGKALANIPVLVNTEGYASVVNEAHTRFRCGDATGYGVSEFMEQLAG